MMSLVSDGPHLIDPASTYTCLHPVRQATANTAFQLTHHYQDDHARRRDSHFFICGYILLYAFATVFAGIFTLVGFWIANKILQLTMGKRIIPWRNHIEFTRGLCVLIFCTLYLIVAVGLLFMHLAGGLPDEYDEIAAQVGIAAFGILVLMVICLLIFILLAFVMWVWHRITQNDDVLLEANEETGLLKGKVYRIYGCKDPRHRLFDDDRAGIASEDEDEDDGKDQDELEREEDAIDEDVDPTFPNRTWMRLSSQSSVRNLDLRRMQPQMLQSLA